MPPTPQCGRGKRNAQHPRPAVFWPPTSGKREGSTEGGGVCPRIPQPVSTGPSPSNRSRTGRERARTVAAFAAYLAENVHGNSDRALEAMASLAEWCDDDPELLAQARGDLLRETRKASLSAQAVVAQNNRDAVELLELAARAS